jgi:hypothetical protein
MQVRLVDRDPLGGPAGLVASSDSVNSIYQTATDVLDRRSRVAAFDINGTLDDGSDLLLVRAGGGLLCLVVLGRTVVNPIARDPQGAPIGRRNGCG